jgi:hypothetical protein
MGDEVNARTRLALLLMVFFALVAWLMFPVAAFVVYARQTNWFEVQNVAIDPLLRQMSTDNQDAADLTKFLTAIVAGGTFSASIARTSKRQSAKGGAATSAVFLVLILAAILAFGGFQIADHYNRQLTSGYDEFVKNGGDVASLFCVSRFRYLVILTLNLLGVSVTGAAR